MRDVLDKVMSLEAAIEWQVKLISEGKSVGVTNGCFDLLHRGHVEYLNKAAANVDALLVLVNSDASIQRVKGPGRPVITEDDRVYMLASLECVSAVVMFESFDCTDIFRQLRPQVYIKGGDYTEETLVRDEYHLLKSMGCRFVFIPFVDGLSTTDIIKRIQGL
jgi:D-beta-D-heptose 7-phosphate kinase/D-beta-D-heptose 1-phosphate adenosyltransferase